jgi:mannose-1-phosphate guanylyltransferase
MHLPVVYHGLSGIRPLLAKNNAGPAISDIFSSLPRISIDFGIMEKTSGLRLVPAQFVWDDIGNWASLERALPADAGKNIAQGSHLALESTGCVIYAQNETVAAFGVSDLIIVQAYGKVLVCSKDRAADLKKLVAALGPQAG